MLPCVIISSLSVRSCFLQKYANTHKQMNTCKGTQRSMNHSHACVPTHTWISPSYRKEIMLHIHQPTFSFFSFSFWLCKSWLSCHNHHKKFSFFFFPFPVPCNVDVHGLFCRWIIMDCFPDYSKLSCPSGSMHLCPAPTHVVGGPPAECGQSLGFLFIK